MWRTRIGVALIAVWLALFGVWLPTPSAKSQAPADNGRELARSGPMLAPSGRELARSGPMLAPSGRVLAESGRVLAVIGRQVGFLNFDAPRPRILTAFSAPNFAMDVTAVPESSVAVISVAQPFGGQGDLGGDLLGLSLEAPEQPPFPLVSRAGAGEWLAAPAWLPDGSALLFQREDLRAGSDLYAGQSAVRYPSRIEVVSASGAGRAVVVGYGHHPSPSPDAAEIAFVQVSPSGTLLLARNLASGEERTLVASGRVPDIAFPRYSPGGDRVAFMATTASAGGRPGIEWLMPRIALAHGLLWNLWVVQRDGSGLHQLAAVGADDASVAWSPDGTQLFVYGSTGARLVDATSGETDLLPYLAGFGAISWLPWSPGSAAAISLEAPGEAVGGNQKIPQRGQAG